MKKLTAFIFIILLAIPLFAQEPMIGEIRMFGGNFAPRGWAFCDGQLLAISQYQALFSILGTTFGGDGRTTFALPDLRGRAPIHAGRGPGLAERRLGEKGGVESVTLSVTQIPSHTHTAIANADSTIGSSDRPDGLFPASNAASTPEYGETANTTLNRGAVEIGSTGGGLPHENMQPYLTVNYIIALVGIYPSRN